MNNRSPAKVEFQKKEMSSFQASFFKGKLLVLGREVGGFRCLGCTWVLHWIETLDLGMWTLEGDPPHATKNTGYLWSFHLCVCVWNFDVRDGCWKFRSVKFWFQKCVSRCLSWMLPKRKTDGFGVLTPAILRYQNQYYPYSQEQIQVPFFQEEQKFKRPLGVCDI